MRRRDPSKDDTMIRPDALIRAAIYAVSLFVVTGAHMVVAERAALIFG
jgi:hypothetical protein